MVLGITGKYCAGKSTVAEIIAEHGFLHIEVDQLGHSALLRRKDQVSARFGAGVLATNRQTGAEEIDRRALGRLVFKDDDARRDLEAIVHPEMVGMVEDTIATHDGGNILVNAALLYRMKLDRLCNGIFWVDAPAPVRLYRAMRRDHLGLREALERFRSQTDVRMDGAQYSPWNVDTMKVVNIWGRKRLVRIVESLLRTLGIAT